MENKNGQGIFYGVIGVATLIVAIIGATFAYFSARVTAGEGQIGGNTLDVSSSALSLSVTPKLELSSASLTGDKHNKLVPADITETEAGLIAAVSANCEDTTAGYTGCHVYEIAVTASNATNDATLSAKLSLTPTTHEDQNWHYALLQKSTTGAYSTGALTLTTLKDDGASPTAKSIHSFDDGEEDLCTEDLSAGTTYYYLVVWLENIESSQNGVTDDGSNVEDATGTYSGTITLSASGGQVKASFSTGV